MPFIALPSGVIEETGFGSFRRAHRVVSSMWHHDIHQDEIHVGESACKLFQQWRTRPVSADCTTILCGIRQAGPGEDIADVVIDDEHFLSGEDGARFVKLLVHPTLPSASRRHRWVRNSMTSSQEARANDIL